MLPRLHAVRQGLSERRQPLHEFLGPDDAAAAPGRIGRPSKAAAWAGFVSKLLKDEPRG